VVITTAEAETDTAEICAGSIQKSRAMKGTVKWYDRVKGYGFLQTEDEKDIFIHRSSLEAPLTNLETGQAVEFDVELREKGPVAVNVKKVE
jgi:CspA family cold shock protein